MKKRTAILLCTAAVMIAAAGCQKKAEPAETTAKEAAQSTESQGTGEDAGETETVGNADFPKKPIQIICPVKAGGDTDYNTRVIAQYLSKYLGVNVIVTNVDGGATILGMQQVLDGEPDGYTMVINGLDAYIPKMMGTTDVCIDSFKTVGIPLFDNTTVLVANSASRASRTLWRRRKQPPTPSNMP